MVTAGEDFLALLQEEKTKREIQAEADYFTTSLSAFVTGAWPILNPQREYHHNWHIDAISEVLEAVTAGEIRRLQIWVPPGSMKSLNVSVFWPAWEWTHNPSLRYWSASYEIGLAGRLASRTRTILLSDWYRQRWGHLFSMQKTDERYYDNDQGGSRLATAPGSTGIGEHGDRILIDDAINARDADATSRVVLEQTNDWFDSTVYGRFADPKRTAVVNIQQRLHENDLAAHLLKYDDEDWTVLCLPERFEADHPYRWPKDPRSEGELLWPSHRDEKEVRINEQRLGTHKAAGQLQQRPSAREGEILKRHWWRYYLPQQPGESEADFVRRFPPFRVVIQSWDTPLKDKQHSDYVAGQCYGISGGDRYLLDLKKGRMNYSQAKRAIKEMALWARSHWPVSLHYVLIENAGYGIELIEEMKREISGVVKITPGADGDKIMRAESASPELEFGNIFLPGRARPDLSGPDGGAGGCSADVMDFVENCARFPNATYDDDVDAFSQAMIWLRNRPQTPLRVSSVWKTRPRIPRIGMR